MNQDTMEIARLASVLACEYERWFVDESNSVYDQICVLDEDGSDDFEAILLVPRGDGYMHMPDMRWKAVAQLAKQMLSANRNPPK